MKISLKVEEDEALRREISKIIKGQVVAISRVELRSIITEVMADSESKLTPVRLNQLIVSEIARQVGMIVHENDYPRDGGNLKKMIRFEIGQMLERKEEEIVKLASATLERVVEDKLESIIQKAVEAQVKKHILTLITKE